MNTVWADRSGVHDDLTTVEDLTTWLTGDSATDVATTTAADLAAFRTLRQALRDLAATLTEDTRAIAADRDRDRAVEAVNAAVRQAVVWPQLDVEDGELRRRTTADAPPATRALAATAAEAVDLFTGPDRVLLRACYAPGCVLYFVKDHPRREWCSPACGNRVRAARHYRRSRTDG
ncbi:putative RNA-binding Zn ribbon-like protein [Saccharothrix variisporea]|uniref:Putative RNA-binding Zn ribbon-like protein n=2 Tax=Saccharothrix variisporea TaxID=543527 RepID=A0A495X6D8_9PSEU|nr:putative RNA-binding Zn ribbon-like protein [Saccharothrix variisporea]